MSFWVSLNDQDGVCIVDNHTEGATVAIGGVMEADLNVTYNYSKHFYECLDKEHGLRALNGQRAGDWLKRMEGAVLKLGDKRDPDYWKDTPGNAGHALNVLLKWAAQYPDATWEVS